MCPLNIKTLIMVTAKDYPMMKVWLPSLLEKGNYTGDILIINYDLKPESVKQLQTYPNIIIANPVGERKVITDDRFHSFTDALMKIYTNYDVVMWIDGNDIQFRGSLDQLFEIAKDRVCYVVEDHINQDWTAGYNLSRQTIKDGGLMWDAMKFRLIVNCGMVVGPAKTMMMIVKWISDRVIDNFSSDQFLLNALVYLYDMFGDPHGEVEKKWNYDARGKDITQVYSEAVVVHRI